jgi:hypothetical protein
MVLDGEKDVIAGKRGHSEENIRYARRRYLATGVPGEWGSTMVASDATHFRSLEVS